PRRDPHDLQGELPVGVIVGGQARVVHAVVVVLVAVVALHEEQGGQHLDDGAVPGRVPGQVAVDAVVDDEGQQRPRAVDDQQPREGDGQPGKAPLVNDDG